MRPIRRLTGFGEAVFGLALFAVGYAVAGVLFDGGLVLDLTAAVVAGVIGNFVFRLFQPPEDPDPLDRTRDDTPSRRPESAEPRKAGRVPW